jgi:GT2 family glycosyltransferase
LGLQLSEKTFRAALGNLSDWRPESDGGSKLGYAAHSEPPSSGVYEQVRRAGENASLPAVDVIILSLDRPNETISAIESALSQQDVEQRVFVVDQGSIEAGLARLQKMAENHPKLVVKPMGYNTGATTGRNIAASLGSAPYIVGIDNDAEFMDQHMLARVCDTFRARPDLGALAFRILNYHTRLDDDSTWDYPEEFRSRADQEFPVSHFSACGFAIRRDLFDWIGGFEEALFFGAEEIDLCYRLLNQGKRISFIPDIIVLHKVTEERRITWEKGRRYYFIARNSIYFKFKFGASGPDVLLSAVAWLVKGIYNGLVLQSLLALIDAARLCLSFWRRRTGKDMYRLDQACIDYISACERRRHESFARKVRKQFVCLSGHRGDRRPGR